MTIYPKEYDERMKMISTIEQKLQIKFSKITLMLWLLYVIIGLVLAVLKWGSYLQVDMIVINQEIHSHISNFIISMEAMILVGTGLLIFGRERKAITLCAVLLILANILCETMLGFVNTVDILDAVYGVGGTVLSYILLWLISQYGVKMD